jgi:hypothetical protein
LFVHGYETIKQNHRTQKQACCIRNENRKGISSAYSLNGVGSSLGTT